MPTLKDEQKLWRTLCEEKKLSQQLKEITELSAGVFFHLTGFGGTRIRATRGAALGDNYMSDPYLVLAVTEDGTEYRSFIKILPSVPLFREAALVSRVYHREIGMFTSFLPKLEQLRQELGLEEDQVPLKIPKVYYSNIEEPVKGVTDGSGTIIVLEDLKYQGFRNAEFRKAGCNFEHAQVALRSLASYHALSIAYLRKFKSSNGSYNFPIELEFLQEKMFFDEKPHKMLSNSLPTYCKVLRNKNEPDAAEWLEKLSEHLEVLLESKTIEDCGPLGCILHGDFWNNNMMFRYKNNSHEPVDFRLIDWQIARPGHPASDLQYFIHSTTTVHTRKEHLNHLLDDYFTTLNTWLKHLGIVLELENYNKESFLDDFHQRMYWGMFMGLMVMPGILDNKMATDIEHYGDKTENSNENSSDSKEEELGVSGMRRETEEKFRELASKDFFSHNDLLCQRVVELVNEVKEKISIRPIEIVKQ